MAGKDISSILQLTIRRARWGSRRLHMAVTIALLCIAALLVVAVLAVFMARAAISTILVYGACLAASLILLFTGLLALLEPGVGQSITLPLGLAWAGARFGFDALSAYFLAVIDLGAAAASLFALGYGRHEASRQRV